MTPAERLRDIDRRAREAATAYKKEAVDLVAAVYEQQGSQSKAAQVLGITQGRVSQLLKGHTPMTTTTGYGTWNNHGDSSALTVEDTVVGYLSGGDSEWRERCESSGALENMVAAYRAAINNALPEGVSLNGNNFYGPYYDKDKTWDGELDIAEIITGIDLGAIVAEHDPDNE